VLQTPQLCLYMRSTVLCYRSKKFSLSGWLLKLWKSLLGGYIKARCTVSKRMENLSKCKLLSTLQGTSLHWELCNLLRLFVQYWLKLKVQFYSQIKMCYTVSNKIGFIHICMYVNFLAVFDTEVTSPQVLIRWQHGTIYMLVSTKIFI